MSVTLSRVGQPVYTIEVHRERVYQFGEIGVLVHITGKLCGALEVALAQGMKILRGPGVPDEFVRILQSMGRSISRVNIGNGIHKIKSDATIGLGAADDLVFDYSGGSWISLNGEHLGKAWGWV